MLVSQRSGRLGPGCRSVLGWSQRNGPARHATRGTGRPSSRGETAIVKQRSDRPALTSRARVPRYYHDVGGDICPAGSVPRHPFIGDLSEPQTGAAELNSEAGRAMHGHLDRLRACLPCPPV